MLLKTELGYIDLVIQGDTVPAIISRRDPLQLSSFSCTLGTALSAKAELGK